MANTNCVVGYFGGTGRNQIGTQANPADVLEHAIVINTDAGTGNVLLQVPLQTDVIGSGNPLSTEVNPAITAMGGRLGLRYTYAGRPGFQSASFDAGRPFLVRLAGQATPASNALNTLVLKLYRGTVAAGTAICTTVANAFNAVTNTYAWILEAELIYNSGYATNNLNGQFWYFVDGTTAHYVTWAQTTTASVASVAALNFSASYTWGNGVGGQLLPSEFSISQL